MTTQSIEGEVPEWTLGDRLRKALELRRITVSDMAELMDVNRGTITRWMHDKSPVRRPFVLQWALITGVDARWLETGRARRDSNPQPSDWDLPGVVVPFPRPPRDCQPLVGSGIAFLGGVA